MVLLEEIGQTLVYNAIQNRNVVKIIYNGDDNIANGERIIEPYVLGLSSANNIVVRAFQPYGDTSSSVPDWKLFKLSNITYWKPTNKTFNAPPERRGFSVSPYNPNGDGNMKFIRVQVNFNGSNEVTNTDNGETKADNTRDNLVKQTNMNKRKQQDIISKNSNNKQFRNKQDDTNIVNKNNTNYPNTQQSNSDIRQNKRVNNQNTQYRNNRLNNNNINNNQVNPNHTQNIQNDLKVDLDNRNQNNLNKLDNKIENGKPR